MFDPIAEGLILILLASLRLGPLFAFAPPFTLIKAPVTVRLVLVVAVAAAMANIRPPDTFEITSLGGLTTAAASEFSLGIALALPLQLAFASIAIAGRALDIQAGFGLAFLIDPTTRSQIPLIGAIFTYATAAIFFAVGAQHDVLAILSASFEHVRLGQGTSPSDIDELLAFLGVVAILAYGAVGLATLVLFLADLVVAMISRTLPQMNVLVLGFQVKSILTILILPATLGLAASVIMRILRLSLETMLEVI